MKVTILFMLTTYYIVVRYYYIYSITSLIIQTIQIINAGRQAGQVP